MPANNYLSSNELAEIIGCRPNSYACMKRWLTRNNWPYVENISGFPKVSRMFHDAIMTGKIASNESELVEPDFDALLRENAA